MQKKSSSISYSPTAKRPWLWLVLVGFLWLQLAGAVHKNLHTDLQLTSSNVASFNSVGLQLEQLLPDHSQQNKSDCQLLDLLCGGLALSKALPVLALPVFALPSTWLDASSFFNLTRLVYQARAPPQTSI